jgi:hypothetical protein
VGVVIGVVILATSIIVHMVMQRAASASSSNLRALQERIGRKASPASTASRRAAKARSAKADRFSNTG